MKKNKKKEHSPFSSRHRLSSNIKRESIKKKTTFDFIADFKQNDEFSVDDFKQNDDFTLDEFDYSQPMKLLHQSSEYVLKSGLLVNPSFAKSHMSGMSGFSGLSSNKQGPTMKTLSFQDSNFTIDLNVDEPINPNKKKEPFSSLTNKQEPKMKTFSYQDS